MSGKKSKEISNKKLNDLTANKKDSSQAKLTTNQGVRINDNQNSLKAGVRGPSLLEDFILREKITHFDHERIPERIVHARGEGAHGFFQVYESMAKYTKANFLQDPLKKTPVFVRFSTVVGSRGSADTVRDVRGFSVKFYTDEGNYDLVGNNIPVFFIQDAIKFPDLVHAVKPEPHHEMPQAQSAHDTFWDFITVMPEAMHMVMWIMSDRAIPRSLRMMEGFGVHTFRFINAKGIASFVKFHWKPLLGVHSLVWDEAQKLAGKDPDFHRRDLWEAIDEGDYPEWELGVQIIPESDEHKFDFDLLDATKLIPEELVPVKRIGKLTLNRNPDNFFAETEQVAFHPGHVVPGIDFTNDPLLQGRLFSYTDTQLSRLGGPNFHEIPINRPVCPFDNNQRDGMHRQTINIGRVAYEPNRLANGYPMEASVKDGGFSSYAEKIDGVKIRARSESFSDHFSQATLFWNSQSLPEKEHIIAALQFELGKVETPRIRMEMVELLQNVDLLLAKSVAAGLGLKTKTKTAPPKKLKPNASAALSMANTIRGCKTRKVAILAADGVDIVSLESVKKTLLKAGIKVKLLAPVLGNIFSSSGTAIPVDHSIVTMPSVAFDGVIIAGGEKSVAALKSDGEAFHFILEAYKHCKTILALNEGAEFLSLSLGPHPLTTSGAGVLLANKNYDQAGKSFVSELAAHRHWTRFNKDAVPA